MSVVGREHIPAGPGVIVANHQSWMDPILLPLALPRKPAFMAMEELWQMPVVRFALDRYGPFAIPIRRGTVDPAALRRSLDVLRRGALLIVFPEGGISADGRLRPFRRGAAMLAARSGAPIVPVAIVGTRDALPLERTIPRIRPVTIRIGTPFHVPGSGREDLTRASETAAARIRVMLEGPS